MRRGMWVMLSVAVAAPACSLGSAADGAPRSGGDFSPHGPSSAGSSNLGSGGSEPVTPPEQEEDQSYRAPVVSGRWVWTANPDTGKVAVVDAKAFTVRLADAGAGPTFLTALPSKANSSQALVINVGSHDATLLQAGVTGPVKAIGPIPLEPNANAWAVSTSGKFAIAWTDSHSLAADASETFQDISVVDLRGDAPLATRLVVGFVPSRVFIDDAEKQAYVVAKSGISVIDLASASGPRVLREVAVSDDPLHEDVSTRDVSVLPDGSYALVRHEGSPVVTLVDLVTTEGKLSSVTLSGAITDLDLVADGKSALAVVRGGAVIAPPEPRGDAGASNGDAGAGSDQSGSGGASDGVAGESDVAGSGPGGGSGTGGGGSGGSGGTAGGGMGGVGGSPGSPGSVESSLVILPLPGIFSAPTQFTTVSIDEVFGLVNIAPKGSDALLYTNAIQNSHLTVLETAPGEDYLSHRTLDLHGYVHDVLPSPDGAYAVASLVGKDASSKPGFAVVPVTSALPVRVQTTDSPVFAVAMSEGPAARAVITVSDERTNFAAYIVRMPELVIDPVKLPSKPLPGATGLVPDAGVAYIAQAHPQGRITFINLETGVPRTITGFEISAKVSDGR